MLSISPFGSVIHSPTGGILCACGSVGGGHTEFEVIPARRQRNVNVVYEDVFMMVGGKGKK